MSADEPAGKSTTNWIGAAPFENCALAGVITARLDRLEELGLLRRTVHSYMPPRTSYELAPAGVALHQVIDAIDAWGREHLPPEAVRPRAAEAASR